MSNYRLKHTGQPFTAVPNYIVNDENISAEALAVITYVAGKPNGWIVRSYDIRRRFKWGDFVWRRVSRELRELGFITIVKHADGTDLNFEIKWQEVDKPVKKPCDPPVGNCRVQNPPVGNQRVYKERYTKKDLLEKNTSLGRQLSVDNSEQLPTEIVPTIRKIFKKIERRTGKMSEHEEHERRKVLARQLEQLTSVKAVMKGGIYECEVT